MVYREKKIPYDCMTVKRDAKDLFSTYDIRTTIYGLSKARSCYQLRVVCDKLNFKTGGKGRERGNQ